MNFSELMRRAKTGDNEALTALYKMYLPLLIKNSLIEGEYSDELFESQLIVFWKCVREFDAENIVKKFF